MRRCKIPAKLLGLYVREVPKPLDAYQMWENIMDGSNVHITSHELDNPDELDFEDEQWLAAAETKEWSMAEDNYYFLTEFTTFNEACDAVKRHLAKHKHSLYWEGGGPP